MSLHDSIIVGLEKAKKHGLTKPSDLAFAVMVAIDEAGLKVIRKAQKATPVIVFDEAEFANECEHGYAFGCRACNPDK